MSDIKVEAMTLRDWFAGQALAGIMVIWDEGSVMESLAERQYRVHVARRIYTIADAMLAVRSEGGAS